MIGGGSAEGTALALSAAATLVALAGSQHGVTVAGLPVFALCAVLCFAIQWLAYVPAYLKQTEHYYDLTGSLTYLLVICLAALASGLAAPNLLLLALIAVWAIRLGSFLFRRVRAAGEDVRFANLKTRPIRFLMTWTLQGLWVFVTLAAALAAIFAGAVQARTFEVFWKVTGNAGQFGQCRVQIDQFDQRA